MITTKDQLHGILKKEKQLYLGDDRKHQIALFLLQDHDYLIWKFVEALRYTEYYSVNRNILYYIWQARKNMIGSKLGITIWHGCIDEGLKIWHYGSVIVNGHARIGRNCQLHGMNCIGNRGKDNNAAPVIGDNVDVGIGAVIIGDIYIADNVKIGANAVVIKSCYTKGATLVGNPAREIIKGDMHEL